MSNNSYYKKRSSGQLADSESRRIYLINKKIGKLTVIEEFTSELKHLHVICKCECGNITKKWRAGIIQQNIKSCGECVDDREDLVDTVFNNFKVLCRSEKDAKYGQYWSCECILCGHVKDIRADGLKKLSTRCNCSPKSTYTGFKNLSGSYWSSIKNRANRFNHSVDLTMQDACNLLTNQNFRCAYTGRNISLGTWQSGNRDRDASLDRINSNNGYSLRNCDWVHKDINNMKWHFSKEAFISWAYLVCHPMTTKVNPVCIGQTIFTIWMAGWKNKKNKKLDCDLDMEYLQKLLDEQNGCCAITGVPLHIPNKTYKISHLTTASVDRVDSNKGHIKGNVQFVHKDVNRMKLDFTTDEFRAICKEVSDYCCVKTDDE